MKLQEQKLLTFLFKLIDVQIKKYVKLTKIGIGPDADINAYLVWKEVSDLLELGNKFFDLCISDRVTNDIFDKTYAQIKFYIDGEDLRARAGWLIDENNIHNTVEARLEIQKKELAEIAELAEVKQSEFTPVTAAQKQYEFDSYAIAHLILDNAVKLMGDPDAELSNLPHHAMKIMRKHGVKGGRYEQKEIKDEILSLHKQCVSFMSNNNRTKSTQVLSPELAALYDSNHRRSLAKLLGYFDTQVDEKDKSKYFDWYNIGGGIQPKKPRSYFNCNAVLFKVGVVGAIASATIMASYGLRS